MTTFVDNFTRADGTTNGVNGWTVVLGTWVVASNALKLTTTSNASQIVQSGTQMASNDHYAQVKLGALVSTFGPICRVSGAQANSWYMLRRASASTVSIYKNAAGTTTTLTTVNATLAIGDVMRIEAYGDLINGYVNGVLVTSVTDPSPLTGTGTGIRVTGNAQNMIWDDFAAGDVVLDLTDPTVAITNPANAEVVSGTVTITGTAADNVELTGVTVKLDGTTLGAATIAGGAWTYDWNTGMAGNGDHLLTAVATDSAGNDATSATVTVSVNNLSPTIPTLSYWNGTTEKVLGNSHLKFWDGQKEIGLCYGRTLSYWDGNVETPISLPDNRPAITPWLGVSTVSYGDSSGVLQSGSGVDYTTSDLWPQLVAQGWTSPGPSPADYPLGLNTTVTNRHAGSTTAQDMVTRMLSSTHAFKWVPASFQMVMVFVGGNDVGALHNWDSGYAGYKNSMSTMLGLLRSSTRVTTFTETGTWAANSSLMSGNARRSTEPGATISATFTGSNATVVLLALPDETGSPFTYSVDGGPEIAGTTVGKGHTALLSISAVPVPIHLRGLSAGSHTIRVTHTGTSGQPLIMDCVAPWYATDTNIPWVFITPPPYSTSPGWTQYPSPFASNTDADRFRQGLREVMVEFQNESKIAVVMSDMADLKFPPEDFSLRIGDGLHPNKAGHKVIASIMLETIRQYPR